MLTDLSDYIFPSLFSAIFILAYFGIFSLKFRPRIVEIIIGLSLVSVAAIIIESYLFTVFGTVLGLLVIAPIIEESLKFSGTIRKRDIRAGIGIGLGFALTENALYFHSFLTNYSTPSILSLSFLGSQIFLFIIMRGSFDPLMHSITAGLSVRTWQKRKRFWLPVAMGFHVAYNFAAIIGQTDIPFLIVLDIAILGPALYLLLGKRKTGIQNSSPEVRAEQEQTKPRAPIHVFVENLGAENLAQWVRSTSRTYRFEGIAKMIGLDIQNRYEKTMWIRRSVLQSGNRKISYTEIGIFGAFLIAALAALGGIIVWVVFL
ncbi:MAG: PrsW family glutamic-type intramembrane protease [Thermoplasmatales archaeon]